MKSDPFERKRIDTPEGESEKACTNIAAANMRWGKRWLIYNNFQTPNLHVRAMHSWHRHVRPGNYGRAYPDFSVLALWNGMSGHRLTEGGTECLGGIFQTGSMCGPCRQLALGPSA